MFQFGETYEDVYYTKDVLDQELRFSTTMIGEGIDDYEKERWQANVSQFSGMLADIGIPDMGYSQSQGFNFSQVSLAGFDLSEGWPIIGILLIGIFVASRKGEPPRAYRPRRRRKKMRR